VLLRFEVSEAIEVDDKIGMGQLGAADSAPPIRRGKVGAATTRHRRFGAGHFDAILTEK